MQITTCPVGHRYDPNIYGDDCPLCAQSPQQYKNSSPRTNLSTGPAHAPSDGHTRIGTPAPRPAPAPAPATPRQAAPDGETRMRANAPASPHTQIHRPQADPRMQTADRKLVGFLVTYNRTPMGKAYNLYEGRNTIGRDIKCDISIPDDKMMSGTHLSILYRQADNKFKFRDEQSSNGTWINKVITDEGEIQNYDIIRAGSTIFIFIAIPKM